MNIKKYNVVHYTFLEVPFSISENIKECKVFSAISRKWIDINCKYKNFNLISQIGQVIFLSYYRKNFNLFDREVTHSFQKFKMKGIAHLEDRSIPGIILCGKIEICLIIP